MSNCISRFIVKCAIFLQQRCNNLDKMYEITSQNVDLFLYLRFLLLESKKLRQAIKKLLLLSTINMKELNDVKVYICQINLVQFLYSRDKIY